MAHTVRTTAGREGVDLKDILREIVETIKEENGFSDNQLAKYLGLHLSRVQRILDPDAGVNLDTVSKICAQLDTTPSELFQLHPYFAPLMRRRDAPETLRSIVTPTQEKRVLSIVRLAKRKQKLDAALRIGEAFVRMI